MPESAATRRLAGAVLLVAIPIAAAGGLQDAASAPALVAGVDVPAPTKIKGARPVYPEVARIAAVEGLILLEVTLNEAGHPSDIVVVGRGVPLLDGAAIEAVRRWEYEPMLVNGTPRRVLFRTVEEFFLSPKSRERYLMGVTTSGKEVSLRLYAMQALLSAPRDRKALRKALATAADDANERVARAAREGLAQLGSE